MGVKEIIIIPYWIEKVLNRNKLNLDVVLNYSELSKVLSTNDISQMLALENYESNTLTLGLSNNYISRSFWNSAHGSQKAELDFVESLARDCDVIKDLINRLSVVGNNQCYTQTDNEIENKCYFKLVDINKEVSAIIVEQDFLIAINDENNIIKLISTVLKNLYTYYTVAEVAAFKVFDKYVSILNQKQ